MGGPGRSEVRRDCGCSSVADLFVAAVVLGCGGSRPLWQQSRNAASQCAPKRTISEHGRPDSCATMPTLQQ